MGKRPNLLPPREGRRRGRVAPRAAQGLAAEAAHTMPPAAPQGLQTSTIAKPGNINATYTHFPASAPLRSTSDSLASCSTVVSLKQGRNAAGRREGVLMGAYTEYLERAFSFQELSQERKQQLARISALRGDRDVLVYAADLKNTKAPSSISYDDILPFSDQLDVLEGSSVDLILETNGGSGEVAEDIVRILRDRFDEVGVIVPGWAKSAGTIVTMAGDEILMGQTSALGPIDAQLTYQGKSFSADALLEGFEKIKEEVEESGTLNRAYVPVLQDISPGDLQGAENALEFAKVLVEDWLARYKFKDWNTHSSTGKPVTDEEKQQRAKEIAQHLCDHRKWLTHGRSIRLEDLEAMRLKVTDYSADPELNDAVTRYYTLLQLTFETNIYKVFETASSQVYRFMSQPVSKESGKPKEPKTGEVARIEVTCKHCNEKFAVQANLGKMAPLQDGALPFPEGNQVECPSCKTVTDLSDARRQLEAQSKKPIVTK